MVSRQLALNECGIMLAAILLGSIKVPYMEMKRRIVEVDEEQLEVAQLEQLIRYMPEPEQMKQLAALNDEYDTLSEAEQFGVVVSNFLLVNLCAL